MRHEVIHINTPIPSGYDSYSLLLIPDWSWFAGQPRNNEFKLFARFNDFGDIIGPRHLAAWFYTSYTANRYERADYEGFLPITEKVASHHDLEAFLRSETDIDSATGGYDISRAKRLCSAYGLSFNSGPYIAYFDETPTAPLGDTIREISIEEPNLSALADAPATMPTFVLRFGGLPFEAVMGLINDLEFQMLREKPNIKQLTLQQWGAHLRKAVALAASQFGNVIELIKCIKN